MEWKLGRMKLNGLGAEGMEMGLENGRWLMEVGKDRSWVEWKLGRIEAEWNGNWEEMELNGMGARRNVTWLEWKLNRMKAERNESWVEWKLGRIKSKSFCRRWNPLNMRHTGSYSLSPGDLCPTAMIMDRFMSVELLVGDTYTQGISDFMVWNRAPYNCLAHSYGHNVDDRAFFSGYTIESCHNVLQGRSEKNYVVSIVHCIRTNNFLLREIRTLEKVRYNGG